MGAITDSELSRRDVLKLGAGAVAGAAALSVARSLPAAAAPSNLNEMTVAQMQAAMASKQLSSLDLVNYYLTRINTLDKAGPTVNSVIEVNPDAKAIAQRKCQRHQLIRFMVLSPCLRVIPAQSA